MDFNRPPPSPDLDLAPQRPDLEKGHPPTPTLQIATPTPPKLQPTGHLMASTPFKCPKMGNLITTRPSLLPRLFPFLLLFPHLPRLPSLVRFPKKESDVDLIKQDLDNRSFYGGPCLVKGLIQLHQVENGHDER